ncbi:hypothetical protein LC612_30580 [Nostoc sp. CHAB 5834]|nr:hypothetical protein [Nostoc sp. CHAB 5834]
MKVSTLLSRAADCVKHMEVLSLLAAIQDAFSKTKALRHLGAMNEDYAFEETGVMVRFELNRVISDDYVTMIRPEIRDGKFVVAVVTNHMLDGLGLSSQKWEEMPDMEDLLEVDQNFTIAKVAKESAALAIKHHQLLIEKAGVVRALAERVAKSSW